MALTYDCCLLNFNFFKLLALDCGLNNTMIPSISVIPMNFEFGKTTFCMTTVFTFNVHKSMKSLKNIYRMSWGSESEACIKLEIQSSFSIRIPLYDGQFSCPRYTIMRTPEIGIPGFCLWSPY